MIVFFAKNIFLLGFMRFIEEVSQYREPPNYCRKSNLLGVRKVLQEYFSSRRRAADPCQGVLYWYVYVYRNLYIDLPKPKALSGV